MAHGTEWGSYLATGKITNGFNFQAAGFPFTPHPFFRHAAEDEVGSLLRLRRCVDDKRLVRLQLFQPSLMPQAWRRCSGRRKQMSFPKIHLC